MSNLIMSSSTEEDQVRERLEEFISYFVKEFEAKLLVYNLVLEGELKKAGKFLDAYAGIIGSGVGGITLGILGTLFLMPTQASKVGAEGGKFLSKKIVQTIGNKQYVKKIAKLSHVIDSWQKNREGFRLDLVEAAFDVFQSFERQFVRVKTGSGARQAMHQLAKDAVNRSVHHMKRTTSVSVSESVLLGVSKNEALIFKPGFEIIYKRGKKKKTWRTADLYDKAGIMKIEDHKTCYYHRKDGRCDTIEYGHRRLLAMEEWNIGQYTEDIGENDYVYTLNVKETKAAAIKLLEDLNQKDERLGEVRLKEVINEAKNDVLEELNVLLKHVHEQNRDTQEMVEDIKSNITMLDIDRYLGYLRQWLREAHEVMLSKVEEVKIENRQLHEKSREDIVKQGQMIAEIHQQLVAKSDHQKEYHSPLKITHYVPRKLTRQIQLKRKCLQADIPDIFAVSNIDISELSELIGGFKQVFKFSEVKKSNLKPSYRYFALSSKNTEEEFDQLCEECPKQNIHWLKWEAQSLIWQRTYGSLCNLRRYMDENNPSIQTVDDIVDNKLVIILGRPGVGKSSLLVHLKAKLEKIPNNFLQVMKLDLIKYADRLSREKFRFLHQVSDFLKGIIPELRIEKSLLLFDGLDEISPDYDNKVLKMLSLLKDHTKAHIWITSRIHLQSALEDKLGVFAYILNPFSIEQQKTFLWKFWETNLIYDIKMAKIHELSNKIRTCSNLKEIEALCKKIMSISESDEDFRLEKIHDLMLLIKNGANSVDEVVNEILGIVQNQWSISDKVEDFSHEADDSLAGIAQSVRHHVVFYAEQLLQKFSETVKDKETEFAGLPLQCRMLAEAYKGNFERYYCSHETRVILPQSLKLLDLYTNFVQKLYEVEYKKYSNRLNVPGMQRTINRLVRTDSEVYGKLAIETIFTEEGRVYFDLNVDEETIENLYRIGIITHGTDTPDFVHRTFAEYFAAQFLYGLLQQPKGNPAYKNVRVFLERHIFQEKSKVIRNFLDRMLAYENDLHTAVLNDEKEKIENLLKKGSDVINRTDKANRTPIHLAVACDNFDIVKLLLDNGASINNTDNIFNWSPLAYADKCHHWNIAELLLQSGANDDDLLYISQWIENYTGKRKTETVLHITAKENFVHLLGAILKKASDKNIVDAQDSRNMTPLHQASRYGRSDIVKTLLKCGANVDARTKKEFTPLHFAAKNGHVDIVGILLDNNAAVENPGGKFKVTPLHYAAGYGHVAVIDVMIEKRGVSFIDARSPQKTPLMWACEKGQTNAVKKLIDSGANVHLKIEGKDILYYAILGENPEVTRLVLCAMVNVADSSIVNKTTFEKRGDDLVIRASRCDQSNMGYLFDFHVCAVKEEKKDEINKSEFCQTSNRLETLLDNENFLKAYHEELFDLLAEASTHLKLKDTEMSEAVYGTTEVTLVGIRVYKKFSKELSNLQM